MTSKLTKREKVLLYLLLCLAILAGTVCLLVLPAVYALPYCAACRVGYSRYLYRRMLRKRQRQKGRDRDGTEHRV